MTNCYQQFFYFGEFTKNTITNITSKTSEIKEITLSELITAIGPYAFTNLYNISEITVSSNLEIVGDSAFEGNKIRYFNIRDIENSKLSGIGQSSFANTALNTIIFPDSLTSIGYKAFHDANHGFPYYLREIKFYDISKSNLSNIGRDAFSGAYNNVFKDIYIEFPEKISGIGPNAYIENWNYYKNVNFYGSRPIFEGYSLTYGGYGPFDTIDNETNISYGTDICMGTFILGNPYNQSYQYAYLYHTVPNIIFDFSYRELWDPINSIDGYQVMPNYNENYPDYTVFRLRDGSYVYLDQSGTLSCSRIEPYIHDGNPDPNYGGYISIYNVIPFNGSTSDISYEISYNDIAVIYIGKNINTISENCFLDYNHDYTDQIVNIYIPPDVSCIGSNTSVFSGHSSRNYNFLNINSSKLTTFANRSMVGDINKIIIPPSVEYIGYGTFSTRADKSIICIQFSDINNSKLHTIGAYCFRYLFNPEPDPPIDNISDFHFSEKLENIGTGAFSMCWGFKGRVFFYGERPEFGSSAPVNTHARYYPSYSSDPNYVFENSDIMTTILQLYDETGNRNETFYKCFDFSDSSNVKFFYNKRYEYSWDQITSIDTYPLFPFIPGYDFSGHYNSNQENIEISGNIRYIGPGAFAHNRNFTKDVFFHGECPEIFTINGIQNFQQNIIEQRIKANIDICNIWYNYHDPSSSEHDSLHANNSNLLYTSHNTFWENFNNARNIYTNLDLSLGYNFDFQISTFSPVFDFMSYDNIKNGEATNILFDFSNETVRKSWDLIASIDGYPVMPNFNQNYPERTVFRLHDGNYVFLAEPSSNTILQNNGQAQVYDDSANDILDTFNKLNPINYNNTGELGTCPIFNVIDLSYGLNIPDSSLNDLSHVILFSDIATCYVGKNITQIGENAFSSTLMDWQNPVSTIFYIPPNVTDFSHGSFGNERSNFFDIVVYFLQINNSQFKNFGEVSLHVNIKNLVIPKLVDILGESVFYGIGQYSGFYKNTGTLKIQSHDIKNSEITYIGQYAFQNAINRAGYIYIPSKVETINIQAFVECNGFQGKMFFLGPRPNFGDPNDSFVNQRIIIYYADDLTVTGDILTGVAKEGEDIDNNNKPRTIFNLDLDAEIIYMYENRESWENITSIDGIKVRLYDESIDGDASIIQYSDNGIYKLSTS